jgi:UrcA family protein
MKIENSLFSGWRKASFTFALLLGGTCASSLVLSAEQQIEEVHAHGERPTEEIVGWSMTGQPMKKVELQYHVRYDDLDLASRDGVDALRKRVVKAALRGCADLGRNYGSIGHSHSCSDAAIRSANAQVDRAVAQARSIAANKSAKIQVDQAIAQTHSDK